jgi:hypothetical protein
MDEKSNGGTAPETTVEVKGLANGTVVKTIYKNCKNRVEGNHLRKGCYVWVFENGLDEIDVDSDIYTCYYCQRDEEERIRLEREKTDRRHLETLREAETQGWVVPAETILAPPKGAISEKILEEMGIFACPGWQVGSGCGTTDSGHCDKKSILWRNYDSRSWRGELGRCEECAKKHKPKAGLSGPCGRGCPCGDI